MDPLEMTQHAVVGAWNSPKTEKTKWSVRIKFARCIQRDSRTRNEEEENG